MNDFNDIVKRYASANDGSLTGIPYSRNGGVKNKFSIIPLELGGFLDNICHASMADDQLEKEEFREIDEEDITLFDFTDIGHHIAENICKRTTQVIVKMRLPFKLNLEQRNEPELYDESFLAKITSTIQEVLLNKLNISPELTELITTVEESRPWSVNDITYIDLRFMLPLCQVDVSYQRKILTPNIIEALRQNKVLAKSHIQPTVDWPDIIQPIGDKVLMYRGKDEINSAPMSLCHIYDYITEDSIRKGQVPDKDLSINFFKPMKYSYIQSGATSSDFLSKDVDLTYWIPMFLSIHYWPRETTVKQVEINSNGNVIDYDETVQSKDPQTMLGFLLPLLKVHRVDIQPYWEDLGQIIFNIYNGDDKGLAIFIDLSSRSSSDSRSPDDCSGYYYRLNKNHMTIKTVACYAREDSLKEYQHWHNAWIKQAMRDALTTVHDEVAEIVYRFFWLEHIWVGGNRWLRFDQHNLVTQLDSVDLRRSITNELVPAYKNLRKHYQDLSLSDPSKGGKEGAEVYIKNIGRLIDKLGNHTYKSTLVKASCQLFEVKNFDRIKDSNPHKTCWSNCVVVCTEDTAYTVSGKLEDFITKSTHIPYRKDFSWQHPVVIKTMRWFTQMFPDRDLKHYVLKDIASYLYGRNGEKLLRAWCGDGNNSKTMLGKCIQMMLGLYCIDFPPSFLTGDQTSSSGPSPELAQAQGAHVGFVPETEDDKKIREGTAKRVTGGDRQFARMCNENGGPMEFGAKVIMMCNKIPQFTTISKAFRNRFIYVPFLGTWCDDAPLSEEEQIRTKRYKNDPFFERQLPEIAQGLAWIIITHYFAIYKAEGLIQPDIVTVYTNTHWEENDNILIFIKEKLQQCYVDSSKTKIDVSKTLTSSEIYPIYKSFFTSNYPGEKIPDQSNFKSSMLQRLGAQENRRWKGIAIIHQPTILHGSSAASSSESSAAFI